MIGALLHAMVVAGLVGVAALLAEPGLRALGVPTRWLWTGAMALSAAIAGWGIAMPVETPAPPAVPASVAVVASTTVDTDLVAQPAAERGWRNRLAGIPLTLPLDRAAATAPKLSDRAVTGLFAGWGVLTLLLVVLLVGGIARSSRMRRRWPRARVLGFGARVAPNEGPAVAGIVEPEIVLPRWSLALPRADLLMIVRHEEEHRRAGDPRLLFAAAVIAACLPWNPVLWWQLRRLRDAVEVDCDARVLRQGTARGAYGELLVRIGARGGTEAFPAPFAAPAIRGTRSQLERRLRAMNPSSVRPLLALGGAVVAPILVLSACLTDRPMITEPGIDIDQEIASILERAELSSEEVAGTGATVHIRTPRNLRSDQQPLIIVDGVMMTSGVNASEFPVSDITSIEVLKGEAAASRYGSRAEHGVILITTTNADTPEASSRQVPFTVERIEAGAGATDEWIQEEQMREERTREAGEVLSRIPSYVVRDVSPSARIITAPAGGAEPAYIVDGVLMTPRRGATNISEAIGLDENDIESIEVMKGAAASSLYGSRAANGMIVITTKGYEPPPAPAPASVPLVRSRPNP